jgi:hypothetical protein
MVYLISWAQVGSASIVFDNGAFSGSQVGRFNMDPFGMFEDFTLTSTQTITGINWKQHDQPFAYLGTELRIYNAPPSNASLIFSNTISATRTPNATGVLFGNYSGFDYSISSLSLTLGPGTYYFGINTNSSGGGWTWDETTGSAQTIPGRWQSGSWQTSNSPGNFFGDEDSVFQIVAIDQTGVVPEPTTIVVWSILGVLGVCRWYRKSAAT